MADLLPDAEPDVAASADLDLTHPDMRRDSVPSEREVALGLVDYEFKPLPPLPPHEKVPVSQRVKALGDQLDPRAVTAEGPTLPLVLLFAGFMLVGWDDSAFGVLLKDIRASFHLDLGFVLGIGVMVQIVTTLLAPLMGYVADRVKRVWMLAAGAAIGGTATFFTGVAPSVAVMAGTQATVGFGGSLSQPAAFPLMTDWYPQHVRARLFAVISMGTTLGLFIGPTLAGALGSWIGWRATISLLGALTAALAVPYFWLREPVRGRLDRLAMGADEETAAVEQAPVSWAEGWRAAASIASLRRIWYATPFLTASGPAVLNLLVLLYFGDVFGLGSFQRGLIGSFSAMFGIIGLAFSGPVADRLLAYHPGRVFTFLGAILFINAVLLALLIVSPVLWLSILVAAPLGLGIAMVTPAVFTLVSMVVPARIRGFGIQTIAPWQVVGFVGVLILEHVGRASDVRLALGLLLPVYVIGAVLIGSAGSGVERDIRAARAASMADEEARRSKQQGTTKMVICRDVDVTYDGTQVLFNVDLDIEAGELVALLGTNGAGKSTLLRAISGIQEASNGAIFLDGVDITHRPAHENAAHGVVFMPGGQAVFPTLSIEENLRAAAWLYRRDEEYVATATRAVLEMFPFLAERSGDRAGVLSGGQQQMLALSQAFLMRPRLLMIDELSLGLAPAIVEQLLDIVRRINAQGTTVVLVEQSVNVALMIAERAVFLDKGRIHFDGPTRELLGRSDLVRSVFLGGVGAGSGPKVATGGVQLRRPRDGRDTGEVLLAEGINVSYGGRRALAGASVRVTAGEVVGIIGPNGAGKTTLFDVISGYVTPDAGTVSLGGHPADGLSPDARARVGLGRSFQNARMFPALTVRENVAVALELRTAAKSAVMAAAWLPAVRRSERRVARRVASLIDLFQLGAYADKFAGELSTGTRRMVDMACIMAAEPRLLLLDEPSSGLAQAEVEVLGPTIRRLPRETGCGVLVIEHDLPLISGLADRLVAMELGAVIVDGRPDDVVGHPDVVRAYLGASQTTIERSGNTLSSALAAAGLLQDSTPSTTRKRRA